MNGPWRERLMKDPEMVGTRPIAVPPYISSRIFFEGKISHIVIEMIRVTRYEFMIPSKGEPKRRQPENCYNCEMVNQSVVSAMLRSMSSGLRFFSAFRLIIHDFNIITGNLIRANLRNAYLKYATLSGANLTKADLSGANILNTCGLTLGQLSRVRTLYKTKLDPELKTPGNLVPAIYDVKGVGERIFIEHDRRRNRRWIMDSGNTRKKLKNSGN